MGNMFTAFFDKSKAMYITLSLGIISAILCWFGLNEKLWFLAIIAVLLGSAGIVLYAISYKKGFTSSIFTIAGLVLSHCRRRRRISIYSDLDLFTSYIWN